MSGTGDGVQVRLAHQRVLTDWARLRDIVGGSADFYRIHADVERQRRRWEANDRRADLLLSRGLALAEAETIVERYGDEVGLETRAYIRASSARAGRAQMFTAAAAVVFGVVAIVALIAGWVAREQSRYRARRPRSPPLPCRHAREFRGSLRCGRRHRLGPALRGRKPRHPAPARGRPAGRRACRVRR